LKSRGPALATVAVTRKGVERKGRRAKARRGAIVRGRVPNGVDVRVLRRGGGYESSVQELWCSGAVVQWC